jgi:large subunit ribosomal protein L32
MGASLQIADGRLSVPPETPIRSGYTPQPLMAVPKRKTSRSRRDKRRAQHGISIPRVQVCPTCRQPKRPHRVCPNCKTYKGRDVEPLRLDAP